MKTAKALGVYEKSTLWAPQKPLKTQPKKQVKHAELMVFTEPSRCRVFSFFPLTLFEPATRKHRTPLNTAQGRAKSTLGSARALSETPLEAPGISFTHLEPLELFRSPHLEPRALGSSQEHPRSLNLGIRATEEKSRRSNPMEEAIDEYFDLSGPNFRWFPVGL